MHDRQLHQFIIITIIVPSAHDSVTRRENALGAPVRSPSSPRRPCGSSHTERLCDPSGSDHRWGRQVLRSWPHIRHDLCSAKSRRPPFRNINSSYWHISLRGVEPVVGVVGCFNSPIDHRHHSPIDWGAPSRKMFAAARRRSFVPRRSPVPG
jgi:hypothetical protein